MRGGDFESFRNKVGELLKQDILKSAGPQLVNAAIKQFLMSSLAGLTGRPNQFIEKLITKAAINPVYKKVANELILDGLEGLFALKEREVEVAEQIEEDYTSRGKEIPRNFQKIIRSTLKEEAIKFEKEYQGKVKRLLGNQGKGVKMIDPTGTKRLVPKEQVKKAKEAGYKLSK